MPVSIAEAMATGAYVLARRLPGAEAYVAEVGALYDDEEEAAELVRATTQWDEQRWRRARDTSIGRADRSLRDELVLRPMLESWLAMAAGTETDPTLA